jgi:hypothetical protein
MPATAAATFAAFSQIIFREHHVTTFQIVILAGYKRLLRVFVFRYGHFLLLNAKRGTGKKVYAKYAIAGDPNPHE